MSDLRDKIYCWGFTSHYECVTGCDSMKESWDRLSEDMREYLEEYDESNCRDIALNDGKFCTYSAWEFIND